MKNHNPFFRVLKKINSVLLCFAVDIPAVVKSIIATPRYLVELKAFAQMNGGKWQLLFYPILHDKWSPAAMLGEYFWQDLFVAKKIIEDNPRHHIDVGSRIDGFIAHLACVREVTVYDIRPLAQHIERVKFVQRDITRLDPEDISMADCVSCLHTIEHIGLGRYGDKLDPDGWKKGLSSLAKMVAPKGKLWISVPIGKERVEFNAHRVFHPLTLVDEATALGIRLKNLYLVDETGVHEVEDLSRSIEKIMLLNYSLGIYLFVKE